MSGEILLALQEIVDAQCYDAMWLQVFTTSDPEANIKNATRFSKHLRMLHEAIECGNIEKVNIILEMARDYANENEI
ncbi:MAG TPA: hypothetical protein VHZ76_00725 [Gammaproteobacteria bacterium]|jgi:hypothetical protein|nr:hypothetical protein [Gammaproteobacteria bacterium]